MNGLTNIKTVTKRELAAYFTSPVAYVFIVIFLLLCGFFTFFVGGFFERGQASRRLARLGVQSGGFDDLPPGIVACIVHNIDANRAHPPPAMPYRAGRPGFCPRQNPAGSTTTGYWRGRSASSPGWRRWT